MAVLAVLAGAGALPSPAPAVPADLRAASVRAALQALSGNATATGTVSGTAASLADGVLKESAMSVWKALVPAVLIACCGLAAATLTGLGGVVESLRFSPDGKTLTAGGLRGVVKVWDVRSGEAPLTIPGSIADTIHAVALGRGGKVLATAGTEGLVRLREAATGREVFALRAHLELVRALTFSPDDSVLATGGADNTVKVWDMP